MVPAPGDTSTNATCAVDTVIEDIAVRLPIWHVAVAVPAWIAVTDPSDETIAVAGSELVQIGAFESITPCASNATHRSSDRPPWFSAVELGAICI
jgi:hypothetical protein